MHLTLTIEAGSFDEIAHLFVPSAGRAAFEPLGGLDEPEAEAEVETPEPKKRRARKESVPAAETASAPESATAPGDEKVTFEDLRAASNALMDKGVTAKTIQDMLAAKFDVKAFGPLKEEQYADCLAELQNLG